MILINHYLTHSMNRFEGSKICEIANFKFNRKENGGSLEIQSEVEQILCDHDFVL